MSELLLEVEQYARDIFRDDLRFSGENFMNHAIKVKNRLERAGVKDEKVLATVLLHDIKKKPNLEEELNKIEKKFGFEISNLLKQYIKASDAKIKIDTPNKKNTELIIQVFLNLAENLDILLIVLADKTENTTTLHYLGPKDRERTANRGLNIYSPLCRFVGLSRFAEEIEGNCFKLLYPFDFTEIRRLIKSKIVHTKIYLSEIKDIIKEHLKLNGIKSEIKSRIKHAYSIFKKFKQKEDRLKYRDYSDVADIAAMRILVNSIDDCYKTEDLLKSVWEEDLEYRKDYISKPKLSGYQSLHCYFFIEKNSSLEIQIRTFKMHEINEYGQASHLFYKMGDIFKRYKVNDPFWLKEIKFGRNYTSVELDHFSKFVYTFTPDGDIIELPKDSTVLDFAYEVHDDIGNHCKAGIVNGVIKKLSYKLQDGDRVEIKVTNKRNVNMDWFEYVTTSKAKKNIRKSLREKNVFPGK